MTQNLGTPSKPMVMHGEQDVVEVRTDDPATPEDDERWIRSDIAPEDNQIATLRAGDGTDIPVFELGTSVDTVREARRVFVNGTWGYYPIVPEDDASFPSRRVYHDGQWHAYHNRVEPGSAIPDSAIHQWAISEGSGPTVADVIGNDDGTIEGNITWDDSEDWWEDWALEGDGSDDERVDTGTLGDFGSNMDSDFAIAATFKTNVDGGNALFGLWNDTGETRLQCDHSSGGLRFILEDNGGDGLQVSTNADFSDNNIHRVVYNKTGNSASDLEIWVDNNNEDVSEDTDENFTDPANFDVLLTLMGFNNGGSVFSEFNGILDNVIFVNDSWSASEIQEDYEQQPWS